jgi:hypothetical protein
MNNERYNQIIDEAYENYSKEYEKDNSVGLTMLVKRVDGKSMHRKPNIEMFVTMCTYDSHFSERWGLKIEERELSLEERSKVWNETHNPVGNIYTHNQYNDNNIPTKLITVTYQENKIEVYE